MAKVKLELVMELEVSDKLKKELLSDEERLVEFIVKNSFRNNKRQLISEKIEEI